jgi:hypothetical protein
MIAFNGTKESKPLVIQRQDLPIGTEVFNHHLYEYKKGLRNLVLQTCSYELGRCILPKLRRYKVEYLVYPLSKKHINIFFGDSACIEIIKKIGKFSLSEYTPEEDFILGIMLGYDRNKQCERYLKLRHE